jgi:ankyrin repeat protein
MHSALPLHFAVTSQDNDSLEQLIKSGIHLEAVDHRGRTALMVAVEQTNTEAATLLIQHGARVNTKDTELQSVLVKAIKTKQTAIAKLLIEHGADCTEELSKRNETVLTLAAWYRAYELFELMVKRVKEEQPKVLERLDWEGRALLHRAVVDYQLEVTEILLKHGVNIDAGGRGNNRALHYAAEYGRYEQTKLLLAYGANREAVNCDGRTALDIARLLKQEACIELLEAEPLREELDEASSDTNSVAHLQKDEGCCKSLPAHQSQLSDKLWENIKGYIEAGQIGRPRQVSIRKIVEGILYKQATGCDWRSLPKLYPRWETVCNYYYRWKRSGLWDKIERLVKSQAGA